MITFAADRPAYFPGFNFWAKMLAAEKFIIADDLKFTTNAKLNRCAIKTVSGAKWLTIPLQIKGADRLSIRDVRINNAQNWRQKHWKSLLVNYKNAAYFEKYDLQLQALFSRNWNYLIDLNFEIIDFLRQELECNIPVYLSSELNCAETGAALNAAWAQKIGADGYLAEEEMRPYLENNSTQLSGVKMQFFSMRIQPYFQQFSGFVAPLSVIDLLFNEGDNARNLIKQMVVASQARSILRK